MGSILNHLTRLQYVLVVNHRSLQINAIDLLFWDGAST